LYICGFFRALGVTHLSYQYFCVLSGVKGVFRRLQERAGVFRRRPRFAVLKVY
jgi:hypothetical protein